MIYSSVYSIFIVLTVSTTCLVMFYLFISKKRQQTNTHKLLGFNIIYQLRELLMRVQQHRGISHGLLNGDLELKSRLLTLKSHINQHIAEFEKNNPHTQPERWNSITEHWAKLSVYSDKQLSTYSDSLTASNNLQQHNKLILNLLYYIEDTSKQYQLFKQQQIFKQHKPVESAWLQLLFTAESIGQIRAIGTGVAASKTCSSVERIRLNYLCHSLQQKISDQSVTCHIHSVQTLLDIVEQQLLQDSVTTTAEAFFNLASECISSFYKEFDNEHQILVGTLKSTEGRNKQFHKPLKLK